MDKPDVQMSEIGVICEVIMYVLYFQTLSGSSLCKKLQSCTNNEALHCHDFLFSFTIETPDSTTNIRPTTDDSTDYATDDSTDDTTADSPECFRAVCRTGN